jgi:hypothetical protein
MSHHSTECCKFVAFKTLFMRFFHPQIQLARESVPNKPDAFYLHVVTYCPRTCFRAFGHFVDDSELDKGKYKVKVRLLEDPEMPDLMYITPVAHTIPLGSIDFPGGEGEVDVEVIGQVPDPSGVRTRSGGPAQKTKTGGQGTVSTVTADTKTRQSEWDELE